MALESGTRLGHYEITDQIGKGGMGEVYRARDTKLGRDVAIKVLPSEFSNDAERLARLEREARMLAALNHPNIAAIYGLEEFDDTRFLVLELIEGDTLADRLKGGAIPVEASLQLAMQIAEALEAAHEKGVIHRDLKPANIKITPDGRVKVLDFGLAKAFIGDDADVNLSNSPTLSMAATRAGIILGTAAYMSPEQARGETADHRADVWAFGVVVFEMLTGRAMFEGRTASDVLAGVLAKDPPWDRLPRNLHPRVRLLLERCLAREVKGRYAGIGDARVDIEVAQAEGGLAPATPVASAATPLAARLPWVAAIVLSGALVGGSVWALRPAPETHQVVRFPFVPGEQERAWLVGALQDAVDIARDGSRFAYTGEFGLFVKDLDEIDARVVQGTENQTPLQPVFSPDGNSLAYYSEVPGGFEIKRVPIEGGTPVVVWEGPGRPQDIRWEFDGTILFVQDEGIVQIPPDLGTPRVVAATGDVELFGTPSLLPDGETLLFSVRGAADAGAVAAWDTAGIAVQKIGSETRTVVWEGGADPSYVPTGHIVYAQGNSLFALPFDPSRLEVTGGPTSVVQNVVRSNQRGTAQYAFSDNGTFIHLHGEGVAQVALGESGIYLATRSGDLERLGLPAGAYTHPRVSPDGTQLAVQATDSNGETEIWVYDLDGLSEAAQLTQGGDNSRPIWSADSLYVTFMSTRDGTPSIWWQRADGSAPAEQLTFSDGHNHWPESWSPDGNTLLYTTFTAGDRVNQHLMALSLDTGEEAIFVEGFSSSGAFSPDGDWVVHQWGNPEVTLATEMFLKPFPLSGPARQVSQNTGTYAIFTPDGTELIYRRGVTSTAGSVGTTELVVRPITIGDPVRFGRETVLPFEGLPANFGIRDFDVLPDGRLVLMLPDLAAGNDLDGPQLEFRIVLNWFDDLGQRLNLP